MFSHITQNWRGKPLTSYEVIVNLIGSTVTSKGLKVRCELDTDNYEKGKIATDAMLAQVNINPNGFHGEWNYFVTPN